MGDERDPKLEPMEEWTVPPASPSTESPDRRHRRWLAAPKMPAVVVVAVLIAVIGVTSLAAGCGGGGASDAGMSGINAGLTSQQIDVLYREPGLHRAAIGGSTPAAVFLSLLNRITTNHADSVTQQQVLEIIQYERAVLENEYLGPDLTAAFQKWAVWYTSHSPATRSALGAKLFPSATAATTTLAPTTTTTMTTAAPDCFGKRCPPISPADQSGKAPSDTYVAVNNSPGNGSSFFCASGYAKALVDYPADTDRTNWSYAYFKDAAGRWNVLSVGPEPPQSQLGIPTDILAELDKAVY
jgi:hypothetical protein